MCGSALQWQVLQCGSRSHDGTEAQVTDLTACNAVSLTLSRSSSETESVGQRVWGRLVGEEQLTRKKILIFY